MRRAPLALRPALWPALALGLSPLSAAAQEGGTPLDSWDSCLLENGSFEEIVEEELREPGLAWWGAWGVPGWRPVERYRRSWTSDPDLFTPEHHANFKGFQEPAHGSNYAGLSFGGGPTRFFITEVLGGRLRQALEPGGRYRVVVHLSRAEGDRQGDAPPPETMPLPRVELLFHAPGDPELPPIVVGDWAAVDTRGWTRVETEVTVPIETSRERYRELVLRGYRARGTALDSRLAYIYVDALSVCPVEP